MLQAFESPILPSRLPISEVIPTSKMDETAKSINIDLIFPDFGSLCEFASAPLAAGADATEDGEFAPLPGAGFTELLDRAFGL